MIKGIKSLILTLSIGLMSSLNSGCVNVPLNPHYSCPKPLPQRFDDLTSPRKTQNVSLTKNRNEESYAVYTLDIDGCRSSVYMPKISRKREAIPAIITTPLCN